ncbi:MAG TPA: DNA-3-methyladenine glycosylase [Castellaniella sp.]|uniref:DNA-3-methyladenine glycosylase n=1 Tax=Castellaniella sp. TaxID=1955812 RepID=UPI002F0B22B3
MPAASPLAKISVASDALCGTCHKLDRSFYDRPVLTVAPDLLGRLLIHKTDSGIRIGRIVEVEAYLGPGDLAAHTSKGRTPRTRAMFGPPGHAYVYLVYGMHHCMNVVTGPEGSGTAVLLRALAPVQGLDIVSNGPGRLCKSMGITMDHYGIDLCSDALWLARDEAPTIVNIATSPRIGVDYAGEEWASKPLRFYVEGHPAITRRPAKKASHRSVL